LPIPSKNNKEVAKNIIKNKISEQVAQSKEYPNAIG